MTRYFYLPHTYGFLRYCKILEFIVEDTLPEGYYKITPTLRVWRLVPKRGSWTLMGKFEKNVFGNNFGITKKDFNKHRMIMELEK